MIRIVNVRKYVTRPGETLIRVDRANKVLGNPYYLHEESKRDEVCDAYEILIRKRLAEGDEALLFELKKIAMVSKIKDVALGCWCYPKRCHGESILKILEELYDI